VMANLADAVTPLLSAHLNERIRETLERRLYEKALALGLAAFESPDYYDKLERAQQVSGEPTVRALGTLREFLSGLIGALGIAGIVARVHGLLALVMVAGAVPVALLSVRMSAEFTRLRFRQSPRQRK